MANYNFVHDFHKAKALEKPIYLLIYFARGKTKPISTKIYVKQHQWNKNNELIINHPGAALLNLQLQKIKLQYQNLEIKALQCGADFDLTYLNNILKPLKNKIEKKPIFTDFMYKAIFKQTHLELTTISDHLKTYKKLIAFEPTMKFEDFSLQKINDLNTYLKKKGYATSTIAKDHKNIKKYIALAEIEGVYQYEKIKHPYTHYKNKWGTSSRTFLNDNELKKIELIQLPLHLEPYRQMFLFLCYTGLRISDFMRINKEMIINDILILKPKKTSNSSGIEVHLPIKILFGGKPFKIWEAFNFEFPNKSIGFENKFNANIKLIAQFAEIHKNLSCHVARHSFLTFIAIKTGNVFKIMKLGGLKKMETALIYIHLAEQDSTDFAKGINWDY